MPESAELKTGQDHPGRLLSPKCFAIRRECGPSPRIRFGRFGAFRGLTDALFPQFWYMRQAHASLRNRTGVNGTRDFARGPTHRSISSPEQWGRSLPSAWRPKNIVHEDHATPSPTCKAAWGVIGKPECQPRWNRHAAGAYGAPQSGRLGTYVPSTRNPPLRNPQPRQKQAPARSRNHSVPEMIRFRGVIGVPYDPPHQIPKVFDPGPEFVCRNFFPRCPCGCGTPEEKMSECPPATRTKSWATLGNLDIEMLLQKNEQNVDAGLPVVRFIKTGDGKPVFFLHHHGLKKIGRWTTLLCSLEFIENSMGWPGRAKAAPFSLNIDYFLPGSRPSRVRKTVLCKQEQRTALV